MDSGYARVDPGYARVPLDQAADSNEAPELGASRMSTAAHRVALITALTRRSASSAAPAAASAARTWLSISSWLVACSARSAAKRAHSPARNASAASASPAPERWAHDTATAAARNARSAARRALVTLGCHVELVVDSIVPVTGLMASRSPVAPVLMCVGG